MPEDQDKLYPDLGKLTPEMLTKASKLRLSALLRDNFTCQVSREYKETAKLTLAMIVPRASGGTRSLTNVYTVEQKRHKAAAGQESPFSDNDVALLSSVTNEWRHRYPSMQTILDEYVRLIREGHRLARIFYFRAFNEANQQKDAS